MDKLNGGRSGMRLLPQTPHSGGMLVALADGSIRIIAPNVANEVFWGMVTPDGGEVVSLD